jgi:hypothetical protein
MDRLAAKEKSSKSPYFLILLLKPNERLTHHQLADI